MRQSRTEIGEEARAPARPTGALLAAALLLSCCSSQPVDATPTSALAGFLEAMDRAADDPGALQEAYRLLDRRARDALAAHARKAETLAGGRRFDPWEMLAPGRYRLRFTPARRDAMKEKIDGDRAVVTVRGGSPRQRAEVRMVREGGGWRVVLEIPVLQSVSAPGVDAGEPR